MSRRRKAKLDLSSPELDAIHQDNTVAPSDQTPADPVPTAPVPAPQAATATTATTAPKPLSPPPPPKAEQKPPLKPRGRPMRKLAQPAHPLSFRLGITDPAVVAAAEALAAGHGADPMLVLKRFVRDAMGVLKSRLDREDLSHFAKVTDRPPATVVLTSTVRIDRDALSRLKAQMDPLDLFAASAVLGFALDQILTETHGL
ncbi:MAG: hypothetical protein AAF666_18020 [Pseudomonadota bacterium]